MFTSPLRAGRIFIVLRLSTEIKKMGSSLRLDDFLGFGFPGKENQKIFKEVRLENKNDIKEVLTKAISIDRVQRPQIFRI